MNLIKKIYPLILVLSLCTGCGGGGEATPEEAMPEARAVTSGDGEPSSKAYGWGFKKVPGQAPEIPSSIADSISRYGGYYLGNTAEKVLYLTFDEGYENGYTPQILDVLKAEGVPAAFFVTGPYLKKEGELVKRMVEEGHIVGNHTVTHPSMPSLSEDKIAEELNGLDQMFFDLTGAHMKYLRPPKGEYSERSLAASQKLGYKTIFWSSAYADWDINKQTGKEHAFKAVTSQFHNGSIILLHAVSRDNTEALADIIEEAKRQGYTFLSLDELS